MLRPRSDEKRIAILEAATRIIAAQGLSAPTAGIAKEAGVPNGSFFSYFETKTESLEPTLSGTEERDGCRGPEGPDSQGGTSGAIFPGLAKLDKLGSYVS